VILLRSHSNLKFADIFTIYKLYFSVSFVLFLQGPVGSKSRTRPVSPQSDEFAGLGRPKALWQLERDFDNGAAADTAEQAREYVEQGKLPAVFSRQRRHRALDNGRIIDALRVSVGIIAADRAA